MTEYSTIRVLCADGIGTITITPTGRHGRGGAASAHSEMGAALNELRFDNEIRVVVITGEGDKFYLGPPNRPRMEGRNPAEDWDLSQGLHHTLQTVIEMEKPVIAKVNGHASGFGASLIFACDFIIACEDAVLGDSHLGMGEGEHFPLGRPDSGTVPGDGGNVFVPLYMSPPLAREYLWLARQLTGAELARMGCINAAVPAGELDQAVQRMASALMRRPPYALALAKRAFNRYIAERFNQSFDLAWSYELLNFYQYGRYQGGRGASTL